MAGTIVGQQTEFLPDWPSCEQQLTKASRVFKITNLPDPTTGALALSLNGRVKPLLHVPDSFDSLWDKVDAPEGYTKYRSSAVKSDRANLRLAPNKVEFRRPVWLAFDPEHGKDELPASFWGQGNIAASEVFSALIQFPEWCLSWFDGASAPSLTGYELKFSSKWWSFLVPCVWRWDGDRQLRLGGRWVDGRDRPAFWSSPTVREC